MNLLEKTAEHKMQIDREILDLERQEQKNRVSNMRWFYSLQGLGSYNGGYFYSWEFRNICLPNHK